MAKHGRHYNTKGRVGHLKIWTLPHNFPARCIDPSRMAAWTCCHAGLCCKSNRTSPMVN